MIQSLDYGLQYPSTEQTMQKTKTVAKYTLEELVEQSRALLLAMPPSDVVPSKIVWSPEHLSYVNNPEYDEWLRSQS